MLTWTLKIVYPEFMFGIYIFIYLESQPVDKELTLSLLQHITRNMLTLRAFPAFGGQDAVGSNPYLSGLPT